MNQNECDAAIACINGFLYMSNIVDPEIFLRRLDKKETFSKHELATIGDMAVNSALLTQDGKRVMVNMLVSLQPYAY